jgi:general secretion pathway protein G
MVSQMPTLSSRRRGFTLIELLVVLGIVALLLTLAVPRFFPSIDSTRETILAENLRNTRAIIDQFHADTGRYPDSLDQLVEKKYLRELPMDPIVERRDAWIVEPPPEDEQGAVANLRSSAPGNDRKGKPYAEW